MEHAQLREWVSSLVLTIHVPLNLAVIMLTDFALHAAYDHKPYFAQLGSVKVHRSLFRYHLAEGEQCKLRGNHAKESSDSHAAHDSPA